MADPATGATIRQPILDTPCTEAHVELFASLFAADENNGMALTKRRGITGTLHRISLITHPMRMPEKVLGVAVRVGRAMSGLMATMAWRTFLVDLAQRKQSLLLIGRPGVGKTTCLREIARTLADDNRLNVVVVDKTCEIAGDGDEPHPAIGKARWIPPPWGWGGEEGAGGDRNDAAPSHPRVSSSLHLPPTPGSCREAGRPSCDLVGRSGWYVSV